MKIKYKNGITQLVEIKPYKETLPPVNPGRRTQKFLNESLTYVKNQNKWDAAKKYAEERKWQFVVWTENELDRMGIMPKKQVKKGLKKLKPLPKKKKK